MLEGAAEELTRLLIAKALAGDWTALRFCVGLLLPVRRDRPVAFDLPEIESAGDVVKAGRAVVAACAGGILSPGEATQVMGLVTSVRALIALGDRETRLIELEKRRFAPAAKTSGEEAAPAASPRRKAFGVSGCVPAPSRLACKSPVFNSLSTTPAGHRTVQGIFFRPAPPARTARRIWFADFGAAQMPVGIRTGNSGPLESRSG
ncbi:MAG: hypothetical protein ACLPKB_33290 [Xanthobacteraceae bacterium]